MSITIVIAEGQPLVRRGLRSLFAEEPDFVLVGESGDGGEAVRLAEQHGPDVLVLDPLLPGPGGQGMLPALAGRTPRTRVVVLATSADPAVVGQALGDGAAGYVLRSAETGCLVEAVRAAAAGQCYLSPGLTPADAHVTLTPREREVLRLAAEGHTNAAIAGRLFVSPRTVEMHRANLLRKLGLKGTTELVRYALRRGLIRLEE